MSARVTVAGAGVIGLTTAVRLAESGLEVDVLARDLPAETTSAASGGLVLPPAAGAPAAETDRARITLAEFERLADDATATGVRLLPGTLLHRRAPAGSGAPVDAPPTGRSRLTPVHAPAPGYGFGYRHRAPVVHMPRYLGYLADRLRSAGGTITRLPLAALPPRGLVVNCTGAAARALAADPAVRPARAQVVLLADPGRPEWWYDADAEGDLSVLPRGTDVVVGGRVIDGDWNPTPDPAIVEALLARAVGLVPALAGARVLGHRVGLRPLRPTARLELEHLPTPDDPGHVRVHCYGHGDQGLAQSWGCADEVLTLVTAVLREPALQD
jgi:D-amino-acid oxidase